MAYVEKTDLLRVFPDVDRLDYLCDGDDNVWIDEVAAAQAMVASYLGTRYDIAAEYAKTGAAREPQTLKCVLQLTAAGVYMRVQPDMEPNSITIEKGRIAKWLQDVQALRANAALTVIQVPEGYQDYVLTGGEAPRNNFQP